MAYGRDETDEFIQPTVIGEPAPIRDGDSVLTFNFRPDRMRQLVAALGEPDFDEFDRGEAPRVTLTTMTRYQEHWDYPVAFPPARPETTIAAVLAEPAASASSTSPRPRSTRTSPTSSTAARRTSTRARSAGSCPRRATSPTYDHKPEMSAPEAAARVRLALARGGRRGTPVPLRDHQLRQPRHGRPHRRASRPPTRAVETVDRCLGEVRRRGPRDRRRADRDRRPRERRRHARAGRQPRHRALDEPRAAGRDGGGRAAARRRRAGGRRPDRAGDCSASRIRRRCKATSLVRLRPRSATSYGE